MTKKPMFRVVAASVSPDITACLAWNDGKESLLRFQSGLYEYNRKRMGCTEKTDLGVFDDFGNFHPFTDAAFQALDASFA